ncbi:BgTH12-05941 [Blumeria graminis f. sp. triticale]|uniref:BgTH12-05941 n=1 Tax=Blumeria graminis f. sp. triticale TaxID=1689686 RepID=A0A9W4D5F6_BLUGR|nr:BgTH12-05941 [Blumeria graminis f. sp. triticale]
MYSRAILISILAAMASSSVSASFIPIESSDVAAIKETRDIPVDVTPTLNDKRANDDKGKGKDDASASALASAPASVPASAPAAEVESVFGKCVPKMIFQGGLGTRPKTEFTFQSSDPTCSEGQSENSNPNIITSHIRDVVITKCGANEDGIALVITAVKTVEALNDRTQASADAWNKALGLA